MKRVATVPVRHAIAGFSLVEILVAMAVFLLMAVLVTGLTDGAMRTANQSQKRISVDGEARQALDRITADLAHAIARPDIPFRIEKNEGNDQITFIAEADGYTPGRGISIVSYRMSDSGLQRGVKALSWEAAGAGALAFTTVENAASVPSFLSLDDDFYETLSSDVIRFEIAFLMGDGKIVDTVGQTVSGASAARVATLAPAPGAPPSDTIRAVLIGVAALDERSRSTLAGDVPGRAVQWFPDAETGKDLSAVWKNFLSNTSLPPSARANLRIYQRCVILRN